MLSPASGCTPSSKILMALLLDTRRIWWLTVSPKHTASATLRPSLLCIALAPLVSFALLLSIGHGLFTNSFLYGDLEEHVYMEIALGYFA